MRILDELLNENAELRALLDETRRRNEVLANENYKLKQTLKTANEQVSHLEKIFNKLKKDMRYG